MRIDINQMETLTYQPCKGIIDSVVIENAEQKADQMVVGFFAFVNGEKADFKEYFMLQDPHHHEVHDMFVKKLSIDDMPVQPGIANVMSGEHVALLRGVTVGEDGLPDQVFYVALRGEPIPSVEA